MLEQFIAEQRERNRRADHALATILNEQRHIKELIMATKDEVVADINGLSTDLDTDFTNISTLIGNLQAQGGAVEASDLDDIKNAVDALRTKTSTTLGGIGTSVSNVAPKA